MRLFKVVISRESHSLLFFVLQSIVFQDASLIMARLRPPTIPLQKNTGKPTFLALIGVGSSNSFEIIIFKPVYQKYHESAP